MNRHPDQDLLGAQLAEALAGDGDRFELAVLAGLLSRHQGADADMLGAVRGQLGAGAPLPHVGLIDQAVAELYALDESATPEERTDALLDFDETCAGAWFCGRGQDLADQAEQVACLIDASPLAWQALSDLATAVLADAPPRPGDPAAAMWRALEVARFAAPDEVSAVPACIAARRHLGILPTVRLCTVPTQAPLLSHDELPPELPVCAIAAGDGVELALSVDPDIGRIVLLRCPSQAVQVDLRCEGAVVTLRQLRPGLYCAPAMPGVYHAIVDGEEVLGEVRGEDAA